MITISANNARLSILGYQAEIDHIYWSALPNQFPTAGQPLVLTGAEITAVYVDGSTSVITDFTAFSPSSGTRVPSGTKTLTLTASYTARSGRIVQAEEIMPVAVPEYIRVVFPENFPLTQERIFDSGAVQSVAQRWAYSAEKFDFDQLKAFLFWSRDGEVVGVSEVEPTYQLSLGSLIYPPVGSSGRGTGIDHYFRSATYDRYTSPTEFETVSVDKSVQIKASYSINGRTLNFVTYNGVDEFDHLILQNAPTAYESSTAIRIEAAEVIGSLFASGAIEAATDDEIRDGLIGFLNGSNVQNYYFIFPDEGRTHELYLRRTVIYFPGSTPEYGTVTTTIRYRSESGTITYEEVKTERDFPWE